MRVPAIIHLAHTVRQLTIQRLEALDEAIFDMQPAPFPNTIRWNAGHIVAVTDSLVYQRSGRASQLQPAFFEMFKGGTRPANWTVAPPAKSELVTLLRQQAEELRDTFASRLDDQLPTVFQTPAFRLETVGDVMAFALYHEGLHNSVIGNLAKVIQYGRASEETRP